MTASRAPSLTARSIMPIRPVESQEGISSPEAHDGVGDPERAVLEPHCRLAASRGASAGCVTTLREVVASYGAAGATGSERAGSMPAVGLVARQDGPPSALQK